MSVPVSGRHAGHRMRVVFCAVAAVLSAPLLFSAYSNPQSGGTFTDPRDGKKYRTVRIGKLTWMAQNLNFKTGNSWCYEDNESNCRKYGRLYDWNTAMSACPAGWRLPGNAEWNDLTKSAGGQWIYVGNAIAYWGGVGKKLKSKTGWSDFLCDKELKMELNRELGEDCVLGKMNSGNGTDNFGFSALPGGWRSTDGSFLYAGSSGRWWSAAETSSGSRYASEWGMGSGEGGVGRGSCGKDYGFSVLCVR